MEKEQIEKALRGYYRTGCFHIHLVGSFNQDLTLMSQEDLGTFLHEYVHFLQNISTPYGIFEAASLNEAAVETFIDIQQKNDIVLPYDAPQSEMLKERRDWLFAMNGEPVYNQDNFVEVDENEKISMGVQKLTLHERRGHLIVLDFYDKQGTMHRRYIGALDIKESMSTAYQNLIDSQVKHPDIPYNLLRIFCKQSFPSVGNDIKKFICICFTSLFSLEPAYHFIELCYKAEKEKEKSGFNFFNDYMQDHKVKVQGKYITPWEHFNGLLEQYRQSIQGLLRCETPYIDSILNRVKMIDGNVPILNVLNTDEPFTVDNVMSLVQALGIPYMCAQEKGWFYPSFNGKGASDVIKLVGVSWLYQFLVERNPNRMCICPLVLMCGENGQYCYDQPWLEKNCAFELIGDEIELKNKKITVKMKVENKTNI